MEKCKNLVSVYQTLKSYSQTQPDRILRYCTQTPFVCVVKVCSNGGATYIIGKIITKENMNKAIFYANHLKIFFFKTAQQIF